MSLSQYHKKRDFSKTSEPKGAVSRENTKLYIIQKHAASHLHYDFRLELQGVLKSWAIPKGPSLDPQIKRLAMHVEDHPIDYGHFEGIIPKGHYGGGTVMLWDKGIWEPLDKNPLKAYEQGHLRFLLHGNKLQGAWNLIRFKGETHWFLIKHRDAYAQDQKDYDVTQKLDRSVLSNQTLEDIATDHETIRQPDNARTAAAKKPLIKSRIKQATLLLPEHLDTSPVPQCISPQRATLVDNPPSGKYWLHEIKFDGYRIVAFKQGTKVILKSRTNTDWTSTFPSIANALKRLPVDQVVVDGEVVLLDSQGKSNFQLLQHAIHNESPDPPFHYFLFDMLYFNHHDLRNMPLLERKSILKHVLGNESSHLHYSDHLVGEGKAMFENACHLGLEGIVSKRINSEYVSKRNQDWLKIKCIKRQEFVVGGYTAPQGERDYFGSLLLGVFNAQGQLEFVGHVGTGFTQATLKKIHHDLIAYESKTNPFTTIPPSASKAQWLKPQLVAEVAFTEWTKEHHLRHPSFKGMRYDKKASEVIQELAIPLEQIQSKPSAKKKLKSSLILSHPDKIVYPEDNITKEEVLLYYEAVSDFILPYLALRPLTLVRCPKQYNHCFYQRHYNKTTPKTLYPTDIPSGNGDELERYIYLKDKAGLLSLVQVGVLEIHPWGSTITHLETPDLLVMDLDPAPDVPWTKVVSSALEVRDYLAEYHLKSFVKSTGGKGLHVVVPITPEYPWEAVKYFTQIFVQFLEKIKPNDYISTMQKSKRSGKIFVDYLRNQRAATAIGTYSTRARLHAPVSTPLAWDELSTRIEDNTYTIKTLPKRLRHLKQDPWHDFWTIKQSLRLDEL